MSNEKQQHTPRPWNVETEDGLLYVTGTHNGKKTYLVELFDHRSIERENSEANARLIAAAPDLLKALEVAYHELVGGREATGDKHAAILKARAAIAKARGV